MRIFKSLAAAAFALLTFAFLMPATPAHAQSPAYLHALSDLRQARGWLESDSRPAMAAERRHAIEEINHAIDEVKKAATDDGKNDHFTPPPQSAGNPSAPLHSALTLLDEAHGDIARGHDRPENLDLQARALQHIDEARHSVDHAIRISEGR